MKELFFVEQQWGSNTELRTKQLFTFTPSTSNNKFFNLGSASEYMSPVDIWLPKESWDAQVTYV